MAHPFGFPVTNSMVVTWSAAAALIVFAQAATRNMTQVLIIPIMIAAGCDSLTGVGVIMLGAGIGTLGSTLNPFPTVIASNAVGCCSLPACRCVSRSSVSAGSPA